MEQFYSLISAFIIILSGLLLIYIMTAIIISIRQNKKNKININRQHYLKVIK